MGGLQRLLLATLLVGMTVFAIASLVSGADYLLWPVGPFPLGNLLTVLGLIGAPLASMLYAGSRNWLRRLCLVAVSLALAWYPVSALLSGNLNLIFSGDRGLAWFALTGVSTLLSLLVPILTAFIRLFDRLRGRRQRR